MAPELGWTTKAHVTRIIDGDTIEVEIRRKVTVRLLDCWAPESRTRDLKEKALGLQTKARVQELLQDLILPQPEVEPKEVTVYLRGALEERLSSSLTMGRVLGRIWLPNGKEVSKLLVQEGLATVEKQK